MTDLGAEYQAGFSAGVRFAIDVSERVARLVPNAAATHRSEGAVCVLEVFAEVLRAEIGETQRALVAALTSGIPPRMSARAGAKIKGYEGEACPDCANFTLVRNGTCLKCETCGATTGCS